SIAAGLASVIDLLENLQFEPDDLEYLSSLRGNDEKPLFEEAFLQYLETLEWKVDIDAVPEGTVMFPHEPLLRVRGPILQAQLLETALLNLVNFPTLIATKSARICQAAQGEAVLEFGLRRAQGIDGSLTASRAAYIGGAAATSNLLAGKHYGIPVKGTHAHSWVMSFDSELEAFTAYSHAMPNNCVFLVDTFDTLEGVKQAIEVGKRLREQGHAMVGVRLDSGDLCQLSIDARVLLDKAGFAEAAIVASNDLDEFSIEQLKQNGAKISVWGVGTKLATAYDQPALGGVYKLGAIRDDVGEWQFRVKLSEQAIKVSNPGMLQVRRFYNSEEATADVIWNELASDSGSDPIQACSMASESDEIQLSGKHKDLLEPVFRSGKRICEIPELAVTREYCRSQLAALPASIRKLREPATYSVGLEKSLGRLKAELIARHRSS
ncbi:MAG: nicotinate phosphoribosyltransferase, partial [Planctomycetota bacterium]